MTADSGDGLRIRPACGDDAAGVLAVYAPYVELSHVTFDLVVPSLDERRAWMTQFGDDGPHRLLVAEEVSVGRSSGRIVGYAGSMGWRKKAAYAATVETTVYVAEDRGGRGIGRRLMKALLAELDARDDVHRILAGVALPNEASIRLHEALGFHRVGTFSEVGFKLGRWWSVAWLERASPGP